MTNWKIARYLIDAKKEVDSLWYISVNIHKINCDIKKLVEQHRNTFYVNSAAVLDKYIDISEPQRKKRVEFKKTLRDSYPLLQKLFYYRDKHSAHKDDDFKDTDFSSIMDIVEECMDILKEVKSICANVLPDCITLDFVCYDAELFRFIWGITKDIEKNIKKQKYLACNEKIKADEVCNKRIFKDTEDLWKVDNRNDYAVIFEDGLTLYEQIQKRQDSCIKTNVLFNQNIWCTYNKEQLRRELMMIKLGYLDIFNQILFPIKSDVEYQSDMLMIENAAKYLIYDLRITDAQIKEAIYGR